MKAVLMEYLRRESEDTTLGDLRVSEAVWCDYPSPLSKQMLSVILSQLVEEGKVIRGKRRGYWRVTDNLRHTPSLKAAVEAHGRTKELKFLQKDPKGTDGGEP